MPIRPPSRVSLLCLALAGLGCATERSVLVDRAPIDEQLERVRQANGTVCAPRELAGAEAHLEFARHDAKRGDAIRADEHLRKARDLARQSLERCGLGTSAELPELPAVAQDSDLDGVPDSADLCPAVAGLREEAGCLSSADADGDGVPDEVDRCPDQAEDRDGFEDEDGCPDLDNDRDGVFDARDACPLEPGPAANRGCPIKG
jgi:OOP family OmpA-OmpF porin